MSCLNLPLQLLIKAFEGLKDYNIADEASKEILIAYLKRQNPNGVPKDFMLLKPRKGRVEKYLALLGGM